MIKDDFEYEGAPKPDLWVKAGEPYVRGGLLVLPSMSDMVRSRNPVMLDNGATIKVDIRQGTVNIELSTYPLTYPPSTIKGVPYYGLYVDGLNGVVYVYKNKQQLTAVLGVFMAGTAEVEVTGGKIIFYASGVDGWGRNFPRTKITSDDNMFQGKEVYIYIYGGGGQVDAVTAQSGAENPMYMVLSAVMSLTYILPIFVVLVLVRQLKGIMPKREEHAV